MELNANNLYGWAMSQSSPCTHLGLAEGTSRARLLVADDDQL